jgi:hypothetical protein
MVDNSCPDQPDYFNCLPYMGLCVDHVANLGHMVICSSDSLLHLIDFSDLRKAKDVQRIDLGANVTDIVCEGELPLFKIEENCLVEIGRYLEEEEDLEEYSICMEDLGHWQMVGNLLYAAQGEKSVVYSSREGSVFYHE